MDVISIGVLLSVLAMVYAVIRLLRRRSRRSLTETRQDILKQAYHLREKKKDVTPVSLAGALQLSQDLVAHEIGELSAEGLLETSGDQVWLTERGLTAALELVRSHRLWERYLADETGVGESRWHQEAEKQEHRLSNTETDALSRRLGHPMYDPHGDPIPQKDLGLPGPQGVSLASAPEGPEYVVIHLEDEPAAVYDELVALDIFRGSRVKILGKDRSHADMECDGRSIRLPLLSLSNITVVPVRDVGRPLRSEKTLEHLRSGETGSVTRLSPACRGLQRRRLLDLGILPGTTITAELESPFGDPVGYRIRGSLVALRKREASMVNIEIEGS